MFWVGFAIALAVVSLPFLLIVLWKRDYAVLKRIFQSQPNQGKSNNLLFVVTILLLVFTISLLVGLQRQNDRQWLDRQEEIKNELKIDQAELLESVRTRGRYELVAGLLRDVQEEMSGQDSLSDAIISRIAALSSSFKPYNPIEVDSISNGKLSPERGQLLLQLINLGIDSSSMARLNDKASFAYADLRNAHLEGNDLRGVDLHGANLKNAKMAGVVLIHADLRGATLWGVDMSRAKLNGADMKRCDLRWSNLTGAHLSDADLNQSDVSGSKFRNAVLHRTLIKWAKVHNAIFIGADCEEAAFFDSQLIKTNLTNANLSNCLLRESTFEHCIMDGVDLTNAEVNTDWMDAINEWSVQGREAITAGYELVPTEGKKVFHLERKN